MRPEFRIGLTDITPSHAIGKIMAGLAHAWADIMTMPCNTARHPRTLDVPLERLRAEDKRIIAG